MSLDVEALLKEVSPEDPCGPAIDYDPAYAELERAAQGKPEQVMGDTVIPAEEPDWRDVRDKALELSRRTRHLRVALYLMVAQTRVDGLPGLRDGLALMQGVLEKFWDHVHPKLDPSDNNDPTERMNIVASVAAPPEAFGDPLAVQRRVLEAPLTNSPQIGKITYRDVKIAAVELPPPKDGKTPGQALIDAAFAETPLEELQATGKAAEESLAAVRAIDKLLTEKVGSGKAPELGPFMGLLTEIGKLLQTQLAKRGVGHAPGEEAGGDGAAGPGRRAALAGEVGSPEDARRALDMIVRYYERSEPSSPVPLMLKGAQRLVSQNFIEIAKALNPDTIDRLKEIAGIKDQNS